MFKNISTVNINGNNLSFYIAAVSCTMDTVAKDHCQKKKQFNGYSACSYCLHPGELIEQRKVRYTNMVKKPELRTHDKAIIDMQQAYLSGNSVNGFKGLSPLAALPNFDVVNGFCIDYMHCVLLGVVKLLMDFWLDSKYHKCGFYIGLKSNKIDERLLQFKPPSNISRTPRSIKERALWHANEFRNWLLYYSIPCLENFLPSKYLKHFGLLSHSIFTLLKTRITEVELNAIDKNLTQFVRQFQLYYGNDHMVYNVHLLTHLVQCVQYHGPLWTSSNFHYEDNNGKLRNFIKGPKDVLKQVASKYLFNSIKNDLVQSSKMVSEFDRIINAKNVKTSKKIVKELILLGKPKLKEFTMPEKTELLKRNLIGTSGHHHDRIRYKADIFHTKDYSKKIKTNDSVVQLKNGSISTISSIFSIQNQVYIFGYELKFDDSNEMNKICPHLKVSIDRNTYFLLYAIEDIDHKCVYLKYENKHIISLFPNKVERD